jgi:hypothetical protein
MTTFGDKSRILELQSPFWSLGFGWRRTPLQTVAPWRSPYRNPPSFNEPVRADPTSPPPRQPSLVEDSRDLQVDDVGLVVPVEPGVDGLRQRLAVDRHDGGIYLRSISRDHREQRTGQSSKQCGSLTLCKRTEVGPERDNHLELRPNWR